MLVYYYIMVGSIASILLYNGGFQCLYITVQWWVPLLVCILLYNGGFQCLYITI